jgi:hypothetical protein
VQLLVDGQPVPLHQIGSLTFQVAETGPRVADTINSNKAGDASALRRTSGDFLALAGEAFGNRSSSVPAAADQSRDLGVAGLALSGAFLIASCLARPSADTRGWTALPDRFQIALCQVGHGAHTVEARVLTKQGQVDPRSTQIWTDVVPGDTAVALSLRLLPGRTGGRWRAPGRSR